MPTAVAGLSSVRGLAPGAVHTVAVKGDGSLWAWGYNGTGALGDGTTTSPKTAPQAVPNQSRGTEPRSSYAYRGDGLRAAKKVAGQTQAMAWDESGAVPLLLSDGDRSYIYGPGDLPIAQIDAAGTVTYLHHDQGGSTRLLTNASGSVVATATYDPYGNPTASTGSATTPLRYAGEYRDAETGFTYLRARYYDPGTGQFISQDPLAAMTGSPYSYADGNPLNMVDPLGLRAWWNPANVIPSGPVGSALGRVGTWVDEHVLQPADAAWDSVEHIASQAVKPFNMAWSAAGFFIVRPLAYVALAGIGLTGAPLVIGVAAVTVVWFLAGRVLDRKVIDPCDNRWVV